VRLYKRGKVYWVQFHNERKSLGVRDPKAAELAFKELQHQHADPTYRPADQTATLATALKSFVERQQTRGRADGTVSMYERHNGHLARVLGDHTPLAQIDAEAVDRYLATRHKEGASRPTQWKELCTLRGALKLARRHKLYPYALDEVMPEAFEGRESEPVERHLLMPDVERLLEALPPERAAVVAFIVATAADYPAGCDKTTAEDIDFKAGKVRVHGSKTAYRDRTVPILDPFRKLLKLAAKHMPFEPWGNVRRDLEVACRRAEVARVTPRDLRRSHGRILRVAGVEPQLIGGMLGHRDGRMVERVYGRLQPEELGALITRRLEAKSKRSTGTKSVQKRTSKAGSRTRAA
jgi:integrase